MTASPPLLSAAKHTRSRGLSLGTLAAAVAASVTAAGCERVSYYSQTGGGQDAVETIPTTSATTTSATGTGTGTGTDTGTTTTTPTTVVTRGAVLSSAAVCAAALYEDVATSAASFSAAAAAAASSPSDAAKKQAARDAWNDVIDRFQQTEVLHVGLAGPTTTPGGKGLRDFVYSWPLVSRCLVEQGLVSQTYAKSDFFSSALINTRGLAATEYLLFYDNVDNACSAASSINSSGSWAALGATELAKRKLDYARLAAADIAVQTKLIADGWSPEGGNFAGQLAGAGQSGSVFSTDQLAMNALTDGLFYLDSDVKDLKLGRPLGLVDCPEASCPDLAESRFAKRSRDHIRNNLIGFRRVFAGCEEGQNIGLDDLLTALGAGQLAAQMAADTDAAIAAADALPSSDVAFSMFEDVAKVQALHAAIKKITDNLKTQFAAVLDVELPQNVEGDND